MITKRIAKEPDKITNHNKLYTPGEVSKAKEKSTPIIDKTNPKIQRVMFQGDSYPTNYCFYRKLERKKLRHLQVVGYMEPSTARDISRVLVWDLHNLMVLPQKQAVIAGRTFPDGCVFKTRWLLEKRIPKNTIIGYDGVATDYIPKRLLIWNGGKVKRYNHYFYNEYILDLNQLIFPKFHKIKRLKENAHVGIVLPKTKSDKPKLLFWKNGAIVATETSNRILSRALSAFSRGNISKNYPNNIPSKTRGYVSVGTQVSKRRQKTRRRYKWKNNNNY